MIEYGLSETKYWINCIIKETYSQHGEDKIIDNLLGHKNGFYIDVGANDPTRFNNTKRFYELGWRGINIEPDLNKFKELKNHRKRDINLNIGIGEKNSKLTFYKFVPDTLSTFSNTEAEKYQKQGYKTSDKVKVQVKKLRDVLKKYCKNKAIDFISIDTEGYEMQVLKSNDWKKIRPIVVYVESIKHDKDRLIKTKEVELNLYLKEKGYSCVFDSGLNSLYLLTSYKKQQNIESETTVGMTDIINRIYKLLGL